MFEVVNSKSQRGARQHSGAGADVQRQAAKRPARADAAQGRSPGPRATELRLFVGRDRTETPTEVGAPRSYARDAA